MEDRFVRGLPETLALSSGLPVLVLPQEYEGAFDPQNVLVAWKSSREAVRAVRDNLTLLRDAKRVTVLSVGTSEETGRLPADQVIHFLERHGISAELRKDYGDNQAGKVVIQHSRRDWRGCCDHGGKRAPFVAQSDLGQHDALCAATPPDAADPQQLGKRWVDGCA